MNDATRTGMGGEYAFHASGNEPRGRLSHTGRHCIAGATAAPPAQGAVFLAVDARASAPAPASLSCVAPERVRASARRAAGGSQCGGGGRAGPADGGRGRARRAASAARCCRADGPSRAPRVRRRARSGPAAAARARLAGRRPTAGAAAGPCLRARPAPLSKRQTPPQSFPARMAETAGPAPSAGGAPVPAHRLADDLRRSAPGHPPARERRQGRHADAFVRAGA